MTEEKKEQTAQTKKQEIPSSEETSPQPATGTSKSAGGSTSVDGMFGEAEIPVVKKSSTNKPMKKGKRKKKNIRSLPQGKAFVHATYNNTIVTFADLQGNVVASSSAGQVGFKGPKKSTPYAASMVVRHAVEKLQPYGMKEVRIFVTGIGAGREGAVRALHAQGINVTAIKDITPMPHNGCRPRKPRRI